MQCQEKNMVENMDTNVKAFMNLPLSVKNMTLGEKGSAEGDFAYFEGYAAAFNNIDSYSDIIVKGAFKSCIDNSKKVKMCWQHQTSIPIGSFSEMSEDEYGLFVKGRINLGVEKGREAYALLKAGDIDSLSIGYYVKEYDYDSKTDIRFLKDIDLMEVSLVTEPANDKALVTSVKSIEQLDSLAEIEMVLRKKGFSQKEAKTLIAKTKTLSEKHVPQRDVDGDIRAKQVQEMSDLIQSLRSFINNHE